MLVRQKAVVAGFTIVLGCAAAVFLDDVRAVAGALAVAALVSVVLGWRHLLASLHKGQPQRLARSSAQPAESGTP